jgi:thioredoxin-dependent peroxiredoxin
MRRNLALLAGLAATSVGGSMTAQDKPVPLAVGAEAPEFALSAATKNGVSPKAAKLLDFRGQTVVLAFFYKARTGG